MYCRIVRSFALFMQAFWRISEVPTPFPGPRKKKAAAGGDPLDGQQGAVSHLHQIGQLSRSSSLLSVLTCSAALSYIQSAPCIAPHSKPHPACSAALSYIQSAPCIAPHSKPHPASWFTPCALRLYACPPRPWIQGGRRAHRWIYVPCGSSGDRVRPCMTWKPSGKSNRAVYRAPIALASLSSSSSVHVHRASFFWSQDGVTPMRLAASA